jgi:hypothetical protein
MTTDDDDNRMTDTTRQEWSRHYDTLLWVVIAIFTAILGAVVSASFSSDYAQNPLPDVGGVGIAVLGVLYVAHFRSFRARLHKGIKNVELRTFLEHPGPKGLPHGWDAYVLSFLIVGGLFVFRFVTKTGLSCAVFAVGLTLLSVALGYLWHRGRAEA